MQACEHSHRHFEGGGALARCPSPLCPPARNRHHSPPTRFIYSRFVHIRAAVWHSTWIICSLLSQFCFSNFQTFSLSCWRVNSYYPGLKMGKWNSPNLSKTEGFECLGHSIWTICSLLSQFCSPNFPTFSLSYWRANSYYPRLKMGKWNYPNLSETEGFECLGHSIWTICSLFSQICSPKFTTFSLLYWRANSYYPRGLRMGKGNSHNSKYG